MELALEKKYLGLLALITVGLLAPCYAYFSFVEIVDGEVGGGRHGNILLSVFLVLQWLWVMGICCLLYCGGLKGAQSEAAKVYKKQVATFLVVFLLLTVQEVIFSIVILISGEVNPFSVKGDTYLGYFGAR